MNVILALVTAMALAASSGASEVRGKAGDSVIDIRTTNRCAGANRTIQYQLCHWKGSVSANPGGQTFATRHEDLTPEEVDAEIRALARKFGLGVRAALAAGVHPTKHPDCVAAETRIRELTDYSESELKRLQLELGIPDELVEALLAPDLPLLDERDRYSLEDVSNAPTTIRLEDVVGPALDNMRSIVDDDWLQAERGKPYRMRYDASSAHTRIHLIGRERLLRPTSMPFPHRLAHMIFLAEDFLAGRHDIDFHEASALLPEFATLGNSLPDIAALGVEAQRKLFQLRSVTDKDCATAVYELLVGSALIRMGRDAEMLVASNAEKTPDFAVHDTHFPGVVECKRRLGLPEVLVKEARHIESLYDFSTDIFERYHLAVELSFDEQVTDIDAEEFRQVLLKLVEASDDDLVESFTRGTVCVHRLPITIDVPYTRVFSANYLNAAFGWESWSHSWDGLIAEVDSTPVASDRIECPRCLKWRCRGAKSIIARSRGITSLWGDASKQIRDGEVGLIYIAYTEQMPPEHADARTQHLIGATKEWHHKFGPQVPFTVVNRLYPQSRGDGAPDFIESALPMTSTDWERLLEDFPIGVFCPSDLRTRPLEG